MLREPVSRRPFSRRPHGRHGPENFEEWCGRRADDYSYELVCLVAEDAQQRGLRARNGFDLYNDSRRLKADLQRHSAIAASEVPRKCRELLAEVGIGGRGALRPRPIKLAHPPNFEVLRVWAHNRAVRDNTFFDPPARDLLDCLQFPTGATPRATQSIYEQRDELVRRAEEACRTNDVLTDALAGAGVRSVRDEVERILFILTKAGEDLLYGNHRRAEAGRLTGPEQERERRIAALCGA